MKFLPTVDAARAVDSSLPDGDPYEQQLAALTVAARIEQRVIRSQRIEIAAPRIDSLPREAPPPERPHRSHAVLGRVIERRRCTLCGVMPGFGPCPFCTGTGCGECTTGWTKCTACDGAREIALAELKLIQDREVNLRATYHPSLPLDLETVLRESIDDNVDPPDTLFFDIERSSVFAPYREAETITDEFFGHTFDDAIDRARAGLDRLRAEGEVLDQQYRAWARPFLVLSWPDEPSALVLADGQGGVSVLRV